jgi:hypothetical protein
MRVLNLLGRTFGRLIVLARAEKPEWSESISWWTCRCECGKLTNVRGHALKNGFTTSCGCFRREFVRRQKTTHGKRQTPEYYSWIQMKDRCLNQRCKKFSEYGGRGITIAPEWIRDFPRFLADMGQRPARTSLDRIDNNGPYTPANCRWATMKQQALNRRSNVWIEWNNERLTQSQWAKRYDVAPNTIRKYWSRHKSLDAVAAMNSPADSDS